MIKDKNYHSEIRSMTPIGIVLVAFIWCIILPNITSNILSIVDNIVVRGLLIALILFALTLGPIEGGAVFFAVALTFLELNRRKISSISKANRLAPINVKTHIGNDNVSQEPTLIDILMSKIGIGSHVDNTVGSTGTYVPKKHMGSNEFVASRGSAVTDGKRVLTSQPLGSQTAEDYENTEFTYFPKD